MYSLGLSESKCLCFVEPLVAARCIVHVVALAGRKHTQLVILGAAVAVWTRGWATCNQSRRKALERSVVRDLCRRPCGCSNHVSQTKNIATKIAFLERFPNLLVVPLAGMLSPRHKAGRARQCCSPEKELGWVPNVLTCPSPRPPIAASCCRFLPVSSSCFLKPEN